MTFGAEMVAMCIARDLTVALRTKLKGSVYRSTGNPISFMAMIAW